MINDTWGAAVYSAASCIGASWQGLFPASPHPAGSPEGGRWKCAVSKHLLSVIYVSVPPPLTHLPSRLNDCRGICFLLWQLTWF